MAFSPIPRTVRNLRSKGGQTVRVRVEPDRYLWKLEIERLFMFAVHLPFGDVPNLSAHTENPINVLAAKIGTDFRNFPGSFNIGKLAPR